MTEPVVTRVLEKPDGGALRWRKARLTWTDALGVEKHAELGPASLRIGSGTECDVVLADPTVSSQHFTIRLTAEGIQVRDRDSTNGTFVNGVRVKDAFVPDGARIVVGARTLLLQSADELAEVPLSNKTSFGGLIGHSAPMRAAFCVLERAASTDVTVLILGETGTGKEEAARGLHDNSSRKGKPFVVIDCGAIAPTLLESELFGHVKGAFTGAHETRLGAFERAHGGTLLLDEIGELPLELQPKLLRAVESRSIQRLGDTERRHVDVRLVASTHRNLEAMVVQGRFRQDLLFRLGVVIVQLPPLRDRPEEIPRLLAAFCEKRGIEMSGLPAPLIEALRTHAWPGNVRELRNVVDRILVQPGMKPSFYLGAVAAKSPTATTDIAQRPAIPPELLQLPYHEAKARWLDLLENNYVLSLMEVCNQNISEVARVSGLSRQSVHRMLQKHGPASDND